MDQDPVGQGREGVEDECNGLLLYLDLLADLDWGRGLLCGDHSASGDRYGENDSHSPDGSFPLSIDQDRVSGRRYFTD